MNFDLLISDIELEEKIEAFKSGDFDKLDLLPKQIEALEKLTNDVHRQVLYGGSAGGGKSWGGCEWLFWSCLAYDGTNWFIGREELKRIMQSTYKTLRKVAKKHYVDPDKLFKLNGKYNYVEFRNGSRIDLLDLKFMPSDEYFERFGSLEYTGGWIEEGGEVDAGAYDVIKTRTGRQLNKEYGIKAKLFITCNPKRNWMYFDFYRPWTQGTLEANKCFIPAFLKDNHHLDGEYEEILRETKDKAKRERLLLGNWEYENDPTCLINQDAIYDMFDNHFIIPNDRDKWITADIALTGSDKLIILVWYGFVVVDAYEIPKSEPDEVIRIIKDLKVKHRIPNSRLIYDGDGVGAFVGGWIQGAIKFVNGSKALRNENYENLKTQCEYKLAELINEFTIWFKADITATQKQTIVDELVQVKTRDADKDGKLKTMKKEDRKTLIGHSPDFSDALAMRCYPLIKPATTGRRTF